MSLPAFGIRLMSTKRTSKKVQKIIQFFRENDVETVKTIIFSLKTLDIYK